MPDSAVAVTAGSGTSIDTRTEGTNGNHRQVVVLGDPATNAGVAPVDATNGLAVDVKAIAAGDNNIGNVDIASIAAGDNNIGNVDIASAIPAGTNNIGDVDVLTVPADPFGANADAAATAGSTGSIQAKLRLMTSQLDSIKTAVEVIDNVVSGSEAQVDIVAALPAGTNNIGDVDIASIAAGDNNIGNVDIASAIPAGTNNIGDVDVLSIAAGDNNIGNVDLASSIPAGTNLIGKISASNETSTMYDGTTALTPKFAVIDVASSGDNTIVAAVNPKKIRVLACALVAAGAVNVRFESGAGGTALTGQMNLAANGGFVLPYNPVGWFETASNTLLNLELSGAVSVDGNLVYVEV